MSPKSRTARATDRPDCGGGLTEIAFGVIGDPCGWAALGAERRGRRLLRPLPGAVAVKLALWPWDRSSPDRDCIGVWRRRWGATP